jgi:hypothetical protein
MFHEHEPNDKPEPRFDRDYSYGRQGELDIGETLEWIARGNGQVEMKRKRRIDLFFYIETHCDKGRRGHYEPSGISITTAKLWIFSIHDTAIYVAIPTEIVREMITDPSTQDKAEPRGSCPTRGRLINLRIALCNYARRHYEAPDA